MAQSSLVESVMAQVPSWDELRGMSSLKILSHTNVIMLVGFVLLTIYQGKRNLEKARKLPKHSALPAPDFPKVTEREDFDLKTAEPVKLRPFKPKYHITMGKQSSPPATSLQIHVLKLTPLNQADATALESLDPNDLLLMDNTYSDRIQYRRRILKSYPSIAVGVQNEPRIRAAVCELYTFVTGTYLPLRYPTMFKVHHTEFGHGQESVLENLVSNEILPTRADSHSAPTNKLLDALGRHVDEDFYLLLPEEVKRARGAAMRKKQKTTTTSTTRSKMEDGAEVEKKEDVEDNGSAEYVLEAYVSCCPSGFNPAEKLGKRLRDIHGPVPGYAQNLEESMDRYFDKVEVGKYVKRVNWSVTMSKELFQPGPGINHAHVGDDVVQFQGVLDPETTFVRCERQTLHRLPKSKALVFAFKTYMYPIREIKEEGLGEDLAAAIDGLKEGNVPEMHFYKRGEEWGNAVKKYLRS